MSRLDGFLALAALLACLVLFIRGTVFSGQQVRRMKWRTRLRMRPGAGFASHWEITFRFSRLAALYHGRRCRPDLRFTDRLICPACTYAVRLGRAQLGRTVYGRGEDQVSIIAVAGSATALPVGVDLPCTEDPELFFAESPQDVETAKAMCRECEARLACLTGALERREPWGVWGGELLIRGAIVPRKRPRGRPRKTEVAA